MLLAPALVFASLFASASGDFILGALVSIDITVELARRGWVVARARAAIDPPITAERVWRDGAEHLKFMVHDSRLESSGYCEFRSEPDDVHMIDIHKRVSGTMSLDEAPIDATSTTGTATFFISPFFMDETQPFSPRIEVKLRIRAQVDYNKDEQYFRIYHLDVDARESDLAPNHRAHWTWRVTGARGHGLSG